MGSELTSVRSILGLSPDPAIEEHPRSGSINLSTAAPSRARSIDRKRIVPNRQIRLDGVPLPFAYDDLRESAYDEGAIGFIAKFLVQTAPFHTAVSQARNIPAPMVASRSASQMSAAQGCRMAAIRGSFSSG